MKVVVTVAILCMWSKNVQIAEEYFKKYACIVVKKHFQNIIHVS